jgi:hypothetical protein
MFTLYSEQLSIQLGQISLLDEIELQLVVALLVAIIGAGVIPTTNNDTELPVDLTLATSEAAEIENVVFGEKRVHG